MLTAAPGCFLCKLTRFVFQKRVLFKRVPASRCYVWGVSFASTPSTCGVEQYRELQKYFNKRVRMAYIGYSPEPRYSMVCGLHHVYFIDANCIYKVDKRKADQTPEQVLDLQQLLEKEQKAHLPWTVQRMRLSPQEKHLAVTLKEYHIEEPRCLIINLEQETFFSLVHPRVMLTLDRVLSFEWATDYVLFYTTLAGLRSSNVFCLDLSQNGKVTQVYEESRFDVFVEVAVTRDQKLLTINCNNRGSSEVMLIDKTNPSREPSLVQRRIPDLLYYVEHWKDLLIILANTGPGKEYQVVKASLSAPTVDLWEPLFCPPSGFTIKDMEVSGDYCVLTTKKPDQTIGLTMMSLNKPDEPYFMELPSWACAFETKKAGGADKTNTLEFLISSPVQPPMHFCLLPEEGLVLSDEGNRRFTEDLSNITTSRHEARSKDGAMVPITLFHSAHVGALENVPLLVHVYGSYGRDLNMEFCPRARFLLEQGWALAYCHIRGGGERGLSWHRQARVEGKQKSVDDLVACLHHLFSSGVSSSSLTALTACSAGAVPVGALCNLHPQLVKAVTLQAPFLDLLGTLEDSRLPLAIEDREEWGDIVGNPAHKLTIAKYCPLHNITPQKYPSMLLTAYNADSRIPLSGIVKYSEMLQKAIHSYFSLNPGTESEKKPNVILNIQPGANHQGQEDLDLMINGEALELAFLYKELGLDHPSLSCKKR